MICPLQKSLDGLCTLPRQQLVPKPHSLAVQRPFPKADRWTPSVPVSLMGKFTLTLTFTLLTNTLHNCSVYTNNKFDRYKENRLLWRAGRLGTVHNAGLETKYCSSLPFVVLMFRNRPSNVYLTILWHCVCSVPAFYRTAYNQSVLILQHLGLYGFQCFGQRKKFLFSAPCSDRLCPPRNLLSSLYMG